MSLVIKIIYIAMNTILNKRHLKYYHNKLIQQTRVFSQMHTNRTNFTIDLIKYKKYTIYTKYIMEKLKILISVF